MANHNELGIKGEEIAQQYLIDKDYKILETNWRYSRAEIDIIAQHGNILVFVEVKTRSNDRYSQPEDSISAKKRSHIADAATRYMEEINYEWEIRFDVISIIARTQNEYSIKHYKDSFFPGW